MELAKYFRQHLSNEENNQFTSLSQVQTRMKMMEVTRGSNLTTAAKAMALVALLNGLGAHTIKRCSCNAFSTAGALF